MSPSSDLSRRLVLRLMAAQVGTATLAGCASGTASVLPGAAVGGTGSSGDAITARPVVDAVTNRKPVNGADSAPWFSSDRSGATRAVRVDLIPPDRSLIGRVASTITGRWQIDKVEPNGSADPIAGVVERAAGRPVLLYIHGYNESFESAVISAAELADGIDFQGATVAFCWPSKAGLLDYGYDRESALWSRDALQDLLEALSRNAMIGKVHVVAHSMGGLLLIETLRQFWAANGTPDVAAHFGAVVFAAPDVDVDLFAASLPRIGPLARHITIIAATNDRALAVSRRLAGGVARVGGADRAILEPLGVKVVDASDYGWGIIRHDLFLSNKDVRDVIKRALERSYASV